MAEVPLEVRLYSSVMTGISDKHAVAFTKPMVDLLTRELNYPISLTLAKGEGPDDLLRFGKQINQGTCHIGVVWGLEYGWLRKKFPRLKPMVLSTPCEDLDLYRCQFMVRANSSANNFGGLKGARLATYPLMSLMDQVYLEKLLKDHGHTLQTYFDPQKYTTVKSAIIAVRNKQADCIVVNMSTWIRQAADQPGIKLRDVARSDPFPPAVLVGRPDLVDELRDGLWNALREKLEGVHQTPEGRQCLDFWRMERFIHPDKRFGQLLRERVRDYPITVLQKPAGGSR